MRKKITYCVIAISLFLISCTKDAEVVRKNYPVIQTHNVSNIDSNGVTFNGEFIDIGYSHIMEYGFVFSACPSSIESLCTLTINSNAANGVFSESISEKLAGNINYTVKAFAKTANQVIYGNSIEFFSQGSKYNPWNLILQPKMEGWHDAHGTSNNELGFILFQSEDFYSYNPNTNSLSKKQNIPIDGNTGTYYASFNLDNYLYILTNDSKEVLRFDINNNQWTKLGNRPFIPNGDIGFFGFSINNIGYFLSKEKFYSYNQLNDTWSKKNDIPSGRIYSAEVIGGKVYVLGDNRWIWSYNPEDNTWHKESQYPGEWNGKIISFTQNDKIYWGLSYYGGYTGAPSPATDFWEYNSNLNNWRKIENFPLFHSQNEIFTFSINECSYFGYRHPEYSARFDEYIIFKFDSQKIK